MPRYCSCFNLPTWFWHVNFMPHLFNTFSLLSIQIFWNWKDAPREDWIVLSIYYKQMRILWFFQNSNAHCRTRLRSGNKILCFKRRNFRSLAARRTQNKSSIRKMSFVNGCKSLSTWWKRSSIFTKDESCTEVCTMQRRPSQRVLFIHEIRFG